MRFCPVGYALADIRGQTGEISAGNMASRDILYVLVQYRHASHRSCTFYIHHAPGVFPGNFFGIFGFVPKIFGPYRFRPENFWIFQLSRQLFLFFSTFDRKFFRIFKFLTEKKSQKLTITSAPAPTGLRRGCELVS